MVAGWRDEPGVAAGSMERVAREPLGFAERSLWCSLYITKCVDGFVYINIYASKALCNPLYHDGNSASVFYIQKY